MKVKNIVIAVVVLLCLEAITFYCYSWLFLLEGQPNRHGDPRLKALAWLCLGAMVIEIAAFFCWVNRRKKKV